MAKRPILDYESKGRKESSVDCGGVLPGDERDVRQYKPPMGPTNIGDAKGPGLHGDNYTNTGTQGMHGRGPREGGSPGLHGESKGTSGSQGRR